MYRVEWNDQEGNLHTADFQNQKVAMDEAARLKKIFPYAEWGVLEYLFSVGMVDKRTGEKISLKVWAENVDKATHKLTGALFGAYGAYSWVGSSPIYENNRNVTRISGHTERG